VGRAGVPLGIGGVLILAVLGWLTGTNPLDMLNDVQSSPTSSVATEGPITSTPAEEKTADFVNSVMVDLDELWKEKLAGYRPTRIAIFRDAVDSACGLAPSATGPFYCPRDGRVYLDLGFYQDLARKLGAPGDFAQAYVLAHEVGHHVQTLMGTERKVRDAQQQDPSRANQYSVALELQADCYAGLWGHNVNAGRSKTAGITLESGDVEEGLNAASAIGDDRLQKMQTGRVMPDSFTHGSSAQRVAAFRRGMDSGRVDACELR
jgi:predicted metalloprotease